MANATSDQNIRILGEAYTEQWPVDSAAARTIYKGEPVIMNMSVDTTHVISQAVEALVDDDVFMGICAGKFTNTLGASESGPSAWVTLYVEPTIVGFKSAVFDNADVGKTVYMSDTSTLAEANGAYAQIGKLWRVEDGYAFVKLESPKILNVP